MTALIKRDYTEGEEIANSLTHAVGAGLAIAGLAVLLVLAARTGGAERIVSAAVYGSALVLLYAGSAFYHTPRGGRLRTVAQAIDHAMIYVLIAATYTPFSLITLKGPWGYGIMAVVWSLAVFGIVREIVSKKKSRVVTVLLCLAMGWTVVVAINPLLRSLPAGGFALLLAGGLAYTAGTIFYALKRVPYMHTVWHLFVIGGSVLHFLAVALYVA